MIDLLIPNLPGAACVGTPPDLWYPTTREEVAEYTPTALAICGGCPVREACLEHAMGAEAARPADRYGIFGGMTARDRRDLARGPATATATATVAAAQNSRTGQEPRKRQRSRGACGIGHPLAGDNLIIRPSGRRYCRICAERVAAERRDRRADTCEHGHPWTDETMRINARGVRICRTCANAARKRYRDRKKAEATG